MMWASFLFADKQTKMTFYSSADTAIIFEGDVQMGWLTSASGGPCMNNHQYGYYDRQSSKLVYRLPTLAITEHTIGGWEDTTNFTEHGVPLLYLDTVHLDWQNHETCGMQYPTFNCNRPLHPPPPPPLTPSLSSSLIPSPSHPPPLLGTSWDPALYNGGEDTSKGHTEVGFDVRTLTTVMSLNMAVVNLDTMTPTTSAFGSAGSGGIPGMFYYDDIYAPMEPFFCVDKQVITVNCNTPCVGSIPSPTPHANLSLKLFISHKITPPPPPLFSFSYQGVNDTGIMKLTKRQIKGPPLCFMVKPTKYTPLFLYPMSMSMFYGGNLATSIYHHCECPENQMEPGCNARNYMVGPHISSSEPNRRHPSLSRIPNITLSTVSLSRPIRVPGLDSDTPSLPSSSIHPFLPASHDDVRSGCFMTWTELTSRSHLNSP